MARYLGPKCKLSRREGTDLSLKSGIRALDTKCNLTLPPGEHGSKRQRSTGYGVQLREKQKIKRIYGVLERQFRNYYEKASAKKASTGEVILQMLECRLDNTVYRMGFASTRSEARQLVRHRAVEVNGNCVSIPSYQVRPNDMIAIREKSKKQLRIQAAIELAKQKESPSWLSIDAAQMSGVFKYIPQRPEMSGDLNESLIVELYSK